VESSSSEEEEEENEDGNQPQRPTRRAAKLAGKAIRQQAGGGGKRRKQPKRAAAPGGSCFGGLGLGLAWLGGLTEGSCGKRVAYEASSKGAWLPGCCCTPIPALPSTWACAVRPSTFSTPNSLACS